MPAKKKDTAGSRNFRDAYKVTLPGGRVVHNYSGAWGVTEAAKEAFTEHPMWEGNPDSRKDRARLVYEIILGIEENGSTVTSSKVAREIGGIEIEGVIPEVRACVAQLKREHKLWSAGTEKYYGRDHEVLTTKEPKRGGTKKT